MTNFESFDKYHSSFKEHQDTPWSKLRYSIARTNLERHISDKKLQILDAGGGNGAEAISYANKGHDVILIDYSIEMVNEAKSQYKKDSVIGTIEFVHGNLEEIPKILHGKQFDLVLCHNVLQYVENIDTSIKILSSTLKESGVISVIFVNKYSEPLRYALQEENVIEAYKALESKTLDGKVFDTPMKALSSQDIKKLMKKAGLLTIGEYGLRCITDYIKNNEIKNDPKFYLELEKLELSMSDRYPYYLIARSVQIIAKKIVA